MRARWIGILATASLVSILPIGVWVLAASDSEALNPGLIREINKSLFPRLVEADRMYDNEQIEFYKAARMVGKWNVREIKSDELNEYLNWTDERYRAQLIVPKKELTLGEEPRVVIQLENRSDRRQVLFPIETIILSSRGTMEEGVRTDRILFEEKPLSRGYLYCIQPRDTLAVPLVLPAQPAGDYCAEVTFMLCRFSPEGTLEMKKVVQETVRFRVLPGVAVGVGVTPENSAQPGTKAE